MLPNHNSANNYEKERSPGCLQLGFLDALCQLQKQREIQAEFEPISVTFRLSPAQIKKKKKIIYTYGLDNLVET